MFVINTICSNIIFNNWFNMLSTCFPPLIVEIPFTKEFHNYLFRPDLLHRDDLVCYDKYIREIPPGKKGQQEEKEIRDGWKNSMQEECELGITINPKVDSKKQRRVQCSFSLKNINIQKFIKKNSLVDFNKPNICRNIEIPLYISSKIVS